VNLESGKITILESKGHKDRIVVMADDVLDLMRKYHHEVCLSYNNRKYFFHNTQKGDKYSSNWIIHTFAKVLAKAGFCKQGEKRPRIYDLRHTFATQRLQQWLQEGEDVESCISFLSEYMGHTKLSDTAYYIHLVPNFYSKSVNRGFQVKTTTFPEVSHED
jgi:integrase